MSDTIQVSDWVSLKNALTNSPTRIVIAGQIVVPAGEEPTIGRPGVIIEGLSKSSTYSITAAAGFRGFVVEANDVTIRNLHFYNGGVIIGNTRTNCCISNCYFDGAYKLYSRELEGAIHLGLGTNRTQILDNTIENADFHGIFGGLKGHPTENVTIRGNCISNMSPGPGSQWSVTGTAADSKIYISGSHNLGVDSTIVFSALYQGNGLQTNHIYYVIALSPDKTWVQISESKQGQLKTFSTNIGAGSTIQRFFARNGIYLVSAINVHCYNNIIRQAYSIGMEFFECAGVICFNNIVTEASGFSGMGISMGGADDSMAHGNIISGMNGIGLEVVGIRVCAHGNLIRDIFITGHYSQGISINGDPNALPGGGAVTAAPSVHDNMIVNSSDMGIQVIGVVTDGVVQGNVLVVSASGGGANPVVYGNGIFMTPDNVGSPKRLIVKENVIFGPCRNGGIYLAGVLVSVLENVQFAPLLTGETPSNCNMITENGASYFTSYDPNGLHPPALPYGGFAPAGRNLRVTVAS